MAFLEITRDGEVVAEVPLDQTAFLHVDGWQSSVALVQGQVARMPGVEIRVRGGDPGSRRRTARLTAEGPPELEGYKIEKKLGEGGMGAVWLATQEGTNRKVAIKTLDTHNLKDEQVARFALEIQVTAQLDHPNIGRLYDSHLAAGLCYYAMEFIDGEELEVWAEKSKPSERQWLELMARVARAVQYAHQKGIIHRDLKPGNVMVARDGDPKVVDFGIAKLVEDDKSAGEKKNDSKLTSEGTYLGTPAYMSPEQIEAKPEKIDTRTDVYAMGVMLYEFICGEHPHGVSDTTMVLFMKVMRDDPRPPRQVKPGLNRDLEAILLRALAKDPEQRYGAAGELADDIQRYLDGEPVLAQPQTTGYLLRKKLAKHKFKVMATMLLAMVVFGYGVVSLVLIRAERDRAYEAQQIAEAEREKAESRFSAGRQFARSLIFTLDDKLEEGVTATRAELIAQTSDYLQKLQEDSGDRPDVLLDIAEAYIKVGEVQEAKGDNDQAVKSWKKAIAGFDALEGQDGVDQGTIVRGKAQALSLLAQDARSRGDFKEADKQFIAAIKLLEKRKKDQEARVLLADTYEAHGKLLSQTGDTRKATKRYEKALAIFEKAYKKDNNDVDAISDLASVRYTLGNVRLDEGRPAEALEQFEKSLELRQKLLATSPKNLGYQRRVASGLRGMGFALKARGDLDKATRAFQESFDIYRDQAKGDPDNQTLKVNLLWGYVYLADVQIARGAWGDARDKLNAAVELGGKLVADDPNSSSIRRLFARVLTMVGTVDLENKKTVEAIQVFEQATAMTGPMVEANKKDLYALDPHSTAILGLGEAYRARGEVQKAWEYTDEALKLKRELVNGSPRDKSYRQSLAHALRQVGVIAGTRKLDNLAVKHLEEADDLYTDLLKTDSSNSPARRDQILSLIALGDAYTRLGNKSKACTAYSKAQSVLLSANTDVRTAQVLESERAGLEKSMGKACR